LEHGGFYPGTVFDDMPVEYSDGSGGVWAPVDYDTETSGWRGLITMREAVRDSVNVYAVKLLDAMGIEYGWQFAKNNLGLPLNESEKVLSLGLGTFEVSTLEMASAYGTFPNNGVKTEPFSVLKVEGPDGQPIVENTISKKRVMKETTAYLMNDLLRTVVTSGTGTRARIGEWYICGKTGTTSLDPKKYGYKSGNPDAWFVGYSPKYTGVVWMGYDSDPDRKHYLYKVYGGSYPASIWKQVMTVAHESLPVQSTINRPEGLTSVKFDTKSGLLPSSLTPSQFVANEICAVDSVPTSVSNAWVEVKVDPNNPDVLASEDSYDAVTKICLNAPPRPDNVAWPADEAPFKMPKSTMSTPIRRAAPPVRVLLSVTLVFPAIDRHTILRPAYDQSTDSAFIVLRLSGTIRSCSTSNGRVYPSLNILCRKITVRKTINYYLNMSGNGSAPGVYTFWAALMENETFSVGPPSNPVTLEVTD
jgi:penicillin-binding protein 1A